VRVGVPYTTGRQPSQNGTTPETGKKRERERVRERERESEREREVISRIEVPEFHGVKLYHGKQELHSESETLGPDMEIQAIITPCKSDALNGIQDCAAKFPCFCCSASEPEINDF